MRNEGERWDAVQALLHVLHDADDAVVCVLVDQTRFLLDVANPIKSEQVLQVLQD